MSERTQHSENQHAKPAGEDFYREAIKVLQEARIPFVVGGAFALRIYADIARDTKDLDVFLRERDLKAAMDAFERAGFKSELTFAHWLAKTWCGEEFMDIIFRAGNGLCDVDDSWFERAHMEEIVGMTLPLCPPEEMIWMKSYIMERERFDGADVAHLIRARSERLNWPHLLQRFGADWRVLLSHLVLFGFIYPAERHRIPHGLMDELLRRMHDEQRGTPGDEKICNGTLISRAQYLPDVERWGYRDGRSVPREPRVQMTTEHIEHWTNQIEEKDRPA